MAEDLYRFMSFRSETPADAEPGSPPQRLAEALEAAAVSFEATVCELDAVEAAQDEATSDLYPDGPGSGPQRLYLYEFFATESDFDQAGEVTQRVVG